MCVCLSADELVDTPISPQTPTPTITRGMFNMVALASACHFTYAVCYQNCHSASEDFSVSVLRSEKSLC